MAPTAATVTVGTTTNSSAPGWSPDVVFFPANEVIPDALVLRTSTVAGDVEGDAPAVRVPWVADGDAGFVPEGEKIEPKKPKLDETVVYTGKVAKLVKLSREQYVQDQTAGRLSTAVRRDIVRAANRAYIAQAAPGDEATTPPAGLLAQDLFDGGTVAGSLDALADGIAQLEQNEAVPNFIIASPIAWGWLRKFKTGAAAENVSLLGAGTEDAERRLLSLPVLTTPSLDAGDLLVVDSSAIVSAVGPVAVATSEHLYFDEDSIAVRATFRFGARVMRPERVARFTVTDPTGAEPTP